MSHHQNLDEMTLLIEGWKDEPKQVKEAFLKLEGHLLQKENTVLDFVSRPGVTHSLRASVNHGEGRSMALFALVDIVDDDPKDRWLSVCFYSHTITDPAGVGNSVPGGILGEDGHCFDLDGNEAFPLSYVEQRVDEAYDHVRGLGP